MKRTPVAHIVFPRPSGLRPVHEFAWDAARAVADTEDLDVTVFIPVPIRAFRPAQSALRERRGAPPWPVDLEARLAELTPRPVLVPYLPVPRRSVESATAAVAARLVARPRASRPRVVQGSLLNEGGYAATRIAHAVGARSIVVAHGADVSAALKEEADFGRSRRARAALSSADRVLAMSHRMAQRLARLGRRSHVLPFFASGEQFPLAQVPRTDPEILFVGRLDPTKGVDMLLDALARVSHPRATLRLVGREVRDFDIRAAIRRRGLDNRVVVHGEAPYADLPSLYAAAHLTALPSGTGGVLRALVESLLVGRPIVATEACGIRGLVPQDVGALVSSLDSGALAHAIDQVLSRSAAGVFAPDMLRRIAIPLAWEASSPHLIQLTRHLLEPGRHQDGEAAGPRSRNGVLDTKFVRRVELRRWLTRSGASVDASDPK